MARPTRKAGVGSCFLRRGKRASRISFSFDTRLSPPSSALYTPLFPSRSTTRRPRSFLSIFFEIPSLSPRVKSPFVPSFLRSQPEEEESSSSSTRFITSFVCFVFRPSSNEDDYNPFSLLSIFRNERFFLLFIPVQD